MSKTPLTPEMQPLLAVAERVLLRGAFRDPERCRQLIDTATEWWWTVPEHGVLARAIAAVFRAHDPVTPVTVGARLARLGVLDRLGGVAALTELAAGGRGEDPDWAAAWATVRQEAARRAVIHLYRRELDRLVRDPGADPLTGVQSVYEELQQIGTWISGTHTPGPLSAELDDAVQALLAPKAGWIVSGIRGLDMLWRAVEPGDFSLIAARPSVGKTAFALQVLDATMRHHNQPALLFSLEMSAKAINQRRLLQVADLPTRWRWGTGLIPDDVRDALHAAAERLTPPHCPELYCLARTNPDLHEIRQLARDVHWRTPVCCIVVDYLQLVNAPRAENRTREVALISQGLKALADELQVPVIALSQLSRASEYRDDHRPRLSDLRESGALEQDADFVLFLHREGLGEAGDTGTTSAPLAELIVAKNRQGETGIVPAEWVPSRVIFREV